VSGAGDDGRVTGFCAQAWERTEKLQLAMVELPFNQELAAGTLTRERFQFYLVQDSRYLIGFARALAAAASRAPSPADIAFFAGSAHEAIVVEHSLHEGFFDRFAMSESAQAAVETSPTCLAYTSFLLATAQSAGYPELLAALLPCFWVYHQVGSQIVAGQSADNAYQVWIDTYADEEFGRTVQACRDAVDRAAAAADPATRERMFTAFRTATEYEWMFWDSAYHLESWPTVGLR
jgi:thiaminase/transcriptional activator TenA